MSEAVAQLLRRPRYEVLPFGEIVEAVVAHVPTEARVTVTASPRLGLDPTIAVAEELARAGYRAVPHLSARLVRDEAHLRELLARLHEAGVTELFVPAGDADSPAGEYAGAAELLEAMSDLREHFDEIGITGYPESHHRISDDDTIRAMFEKAPMATCIVSQLCLDPTTIAWWIGQVRGRGTHLPIWVGVPGAVEHAKLLRISMRIGLGESVRFLGAHRSWLRRLATRQFRPDALIRKLAPTLSESDAGIAGFHLYTFNEVEATERWRRRTLERLAEDGVMAG